MAIFDITGVLRTFVDAGVDFIVVGGVAASMNGAVVNTQDIDLVQSRAPENVARIVGVLEALEAFCRFPSERRLRPNASHLTGRGHVNLTTLIGYVDLLGTIGNGLGYEDLLPHSQWMAADEGLTVRVLDLETLIKLKEELGRDKDRYMLPILRQALKLKQAKDLPPSAG